MRYGFRPPNCPNPLCVAHKSATKTRFYKKAGKFITKYNHQPVPRYQCLYCSKKFSSHTFRATFLQKRPDLNKKVFSLYCSGMTQTRMAKELKCDVKTIARKFLFLALQARKLHALNIKRTHSVKTAQFDEMESFEHTRLKPLNIALAVSGDGKTIIDANVGTLAYKGRLSSLAQKKYGPRIDTSQLARLRTLSSVAKLSIDNITLVTDAKPCYKKEISTILPSCLHLQVKNRKNQLQYATRPLVRKNQNDKMFWLNHIAARIRNDLSRMMRKTWTTSKKTSHLEAHLMLFIAYYNKYTI